MSDAPDCASCGHGAWDHDPVPITGIRRDGRSTGWYTRGRCTVEDHDGRLIWSCLCRKYVPEPYPRLAELLGFDVLRMAA